MLLNALRHLKASSSGHPNKEVVLVLNQEYQHILTKLARCWVFNIVVTCLN